jgi:shikimate kinase
MKIYLVGMPGSGKSTLGKQLARKLQFEFVDLDKEIETREGLEVQEIFATRGEDHFRLIESQILREWAGSEKSFVMATGGGAPCFYDGMNAINDSGLSIFIDEPLSVLIPRLESKANRPLLQSANPTEMKEKLQALWDIRSPLYRTASIIIKEANLSKLMEVIRLKM